MHWSSQTPPPPTMGGELGHVHVTSLSTSDATFRKFPNQNQTDTD